MVHFQRPAALSQGFDEDFEESISEEAWEEFLEVSVQHQPKKQSDFFFKLVVFRKQLFNLPKTFFGGETEGNTRKCT